jgi:hypothetical protein
VIVERVRCLLDNRDGLLPESRLVLTYNVEAARELQERLDDDVGPATRARMTVSSFHSFCQRILTESAADAGLPPHLDVLDGVAQVLLLKDIHGGRTERGRGCASIQACVRCHPALPAGPGRAMRVEHEYDRGGALAHLAAGDVGSARLFGHCEPTTGIEPFGWLVGQVMALEPYRPAQGAAPA